MPGDAAEIAFIALGSNLGDSPQIIRRAFARLQTLSDAPILRSSLWQSTPVDCPSGSPAFINAMAGIHPHAEETPQTLLRRLQTLEREFGRRRAGIPNAPRLLDLDLIAFGQITLNLPDFVLPHPRAHLRRFVLQPLAEIAPDFILSGQTRSALILLQGLSDTETVVKWDESHRSC